MEKIDFHIHTQPDIFKDNEFKFSLDWLERYVKQSRLDAIAVTNHNLFDIDQFNEIDNNLNCKVFPGMELSLENYHVQVIYDNDKIHKNELMHASQRLQDLNLGDRRGISISQFKEIFVDWKNSILVFEFGKSNNIKNISTELSDALCLVGVSSPHKFNKVYLQKDMPTPVLFSDAHATKNNSDVTRNNINKLMFKQTFVECDDSRYMSIYNALKNKSCVGLTSNMLKDSFNIKIDNGKNVKVSTGLNLIIGNRGSGKTYFLKNIKKLVDESELFEIAQFQSAEKANDILDTEKTKAINTEFKQWKSDYKDQWDFIYDNFIKNDQFLMKESFVEKLDNYLDNLRSYHKRNNNNSIANKIVLFKETKFVPNDLISILDDKLRQINNLTNSLELWNYMEINTNNSVYKLKEDIVHFKLLLEEKLKNDKLKEKIKEKVNSILQSIQNVITSQTGVPLIPKINILSLYKRYYFTKKVNMFLNKIVNKKTLGVSNVDIYKIKVNLLPYEKVTEFKKSCSLKNISFQEPFNKFYKKKQYVQFLKEIKTSIGDIPRDSLEKIFINIKAELLTSDDIPVSGGEKVGFSLMLALEEAKDKQYVIVDEPEASLDNKFIKERLISKLQEVSEKSTVFVVTHNSTLGSLLCPNYLIVAKREHNDYSYLSGGFKQKKISNGNLEIPSDKDFINAMEAGFDTYREKGKIYENLRDH
ncbi:hypothetical protein [Ligilactobacillus cholophilus]|uniref:hypothetical protein n=1 Tax=Ligilactobacillus cholophilus TaxID=3050131 RepID=UPI0025B1AB19|nr:hypothetical protein [Ligilactobacillus cholophilus]